VSTIEKAPHRNPGERNPSFTSNVSLKLTDHFQLRTATAVGKISFVPSCRVTATER